MAAITGSEGGVLLWPIEEGGLWGGDRCGFATWEGGRGAAPMAREKGEAALGRCEEEESRVPRGPEGLMGRLAAGAGRPNGPAGRVGREAKCEGKEFPD
jgi:hypothetical protein